MDGNSWRQRLGFGGSRGDGWLEWNLWCGGRKERWDRCGGDIADEGCVRGSLVATMPPSVTPALQRECHISASQEEVLANLGGGWERSVHFVLDDTPSQHVFLMANVVAPAGPNGNETVSADSSSDSDDDEFRIVGYTQEPVEWYSPPSSSTHVEEAKEIAKIMMEESYNAAFESDRSQSPDEHSNVPVKHPEPEYVSDGAESDGEPIMEPALGATCIQPSPQMDDEETGEMHSQPLMGDGETGVFHSQPLMGDGEIGTMQFQPHTQQVGDGETGETEDQGAMEDTCKSPPKPLSIAETQLSSAPKHWSPTTAAAAVNDTGRNVFELMSVQPITQPAYETQPSELPMEVFTTPLRSRPYFVVLYTLHRFLINVIEMHSCVSPVFEILKLLVSGWGLADYEDDN